MGRTCSVARCADDTAHARTWPSCLRPPLFHELHCFGFAAPIRQSKVCVIKVFLPVLPPFTLLTEQVCEGLDLGVMKMKKGEKALICVQPQYGFGAAGHSGRLAVVPPSTAVTYEVELLDFENGKESWEMSDAEKVRVRNWFLICCFAVVLCSFLCSFVDFCVRASCLSLFV